MVGRGDRDRVDALVVEHPPDVLLDLRGRLALLREERLDSRIEQARIGIAQGGDLDVLEPVVTAQMRLAAPVEAHHRDADAVAGACPTRPGRAEEDRGRGGRLDEIPARHLLHVDRPFLWPEVRHLCVSSASSRILHHSRGSPITHPDWSPVQRSCPTQMSSSTITGFASFWVPAVSVTRYVPGATTRPGCGWALAGASRGRRHRVAPQVPKQPAHAHGARAGQRPHGLALDVRDRDLHAARGRGPEVVRDGGARRRVLAAPLLRAARHLARAGCPAPTASPFSRRTDAHPPSSRSPTAAAAA